MTGSPSEGSGPVRIESLRLTAEEIAFRARADRRLMNWPVVYTLEGGREVYVGESRHVATRLRQHLDSRERGHLVRARVILDDTFNKSACLDLESYLIRLLSGDGERIVLNRNDGVVDSDYFDRARYQATFDRILDDLLQQGLFTRPVRDIENSDLFKLSPFKALTNDQEAAVESILEGFFEDRAQQVPSRTVVQGEPGTGKTVLAIYLLKLLMDIRDADPEEPVDGDSRFADFFTPDHPERVAGLRVGFVVPQQSLRASVRQVFARTPGLSADMVLSPFDVGASEQRFGLLVVDEAHRLSQRANQPSGVLNRKFADINRRLFGEDAAELTQLDWIQDRSDHQILMLDPLQTVRPADLPARVVVPLVAEARSQGRLHTLRSQLRVAAGDDYLGFVRSLLGDEPVAPRAFPGYDLRLFDDLSVMRAELARREAESGLARLVAGYAWAWASKNDPTAVDIELDGVGLQWNSTAVDWVHSARAVDEVGSIHTVQGYDLNYAGVIIGRDLAWDDSAQRVRFQREHYFDKKGRENNPTLGITYTDEDLLAYVRNIYAVLLTRGILGTYVYVCDPGLRRRFAHTLAT